MNWTGPATPQDDQPQLRSDSTRSALDFVGEMSAAAAQGPIHLETRLAQMARVFQARSAGLAGLVNNNVEVQFGMSADGKSLRSLHWPPDKWTGLLAEVRSAPTAVAAVLPDANGYLFTSCPAPGGANWLLWLEVAVERVWSLAERSSFALAGLALVRCLISPTAANRWNGWLERVQRQQRLESAAAIIARMVHDFNNVLTGIMGFTELSLGQIPLGSTPHQFMTEVFQAAQQGTQLLNQLSCFSKRSVARPLSTSLTQAAEKEQQRVHPLWGETVALRVEVPGDLPALAIDGESLQLILGRLLDNAREAIAAKGVVTVSARLAELTSETCMEVIGNASPGSCVEVAVSDSGSGFSLEARQRVLFEPFYSNKPRHRGLGLAAVYGTLFVHRGGLRLDHGVTSGTTVRFCLPVARREGSTLSIRRNTLPLARGERLLVVDDDPLTLQLMCTTLERAGYRVHSAVDGVQALETFTLTTEPFGLVLTDVVMPRMTGFDLAQRLLEREPTVNLLFTSGHIPPGFVPESFVGRNFDLLPKPFRPEGLLRSVRCALDRGVPGRGASPMSVATEKST